MVINRRRFLTGVSSVAYQMAQNSLYAHDNDIDLLIRGGLIVDGTGGDPFVGDIGIKNGRIATVQSRCDFSAYRTIDATGLTVSPGFIDIHTHSDYTLLGDGRANSKIRQGVTTEIVGMDGKSAAPITDRSLEVFQSVNGFTPEWRDFSGYYRTLLEGGISVNLRSMVGAGMLRASVAGIDKRAVTGSEMERMIDLYKGSERQGARGISSGLEYIPGSYATEAELVSLTKGAGIYSTHTRNEDDHVVDALIEAIRIGEKSGCHLHITHLKAQGRRNWKDLPVLIERMNRSRSFRLPITCDMYPFTAYASRLITLFPLWSREGGEESLRGRLLDPHHNYNIRVGVERKIQSIGSWNDIIPVDLQSESFRSFRMAAIGDIARRLRRSSYDVLREMALSGDVNRSIIVFAMSQANIEKLIVYPMCAFASDGSAISTEIRSVSHPRNFGTFPEILGKYVRNRGLITIQEAIRKMTLLPAQIMGIPDRGLLARGQFADLVIFNGSSIANLADYDNSNYPRGIEYVIVNGEVIIEKGDHTGIKSGKIV